jgi:hypothetical protein
MSGLQGRRGANPAAIAIHQAAIAKNYPLVFLLMAQYWATAVFNVTFGHKDSFKHPTDPPILENKVSFPLGEPAPSFKLDGYRKEGRVPPGALSYP